MVEIPEAKKCCLCLPLRRGLLAWVYFKVGVTIGFLFAVSLLLAILVDFIGFHWILGIFIYVEVILALEIIFDISFIINAHNKKYVYLRIYYRYQLVMLVNDIILFVGYTVYVVYEYGQEWSKLGIYSAIGCLILSLIALRIYFIYLVRSEVRKLQLTTQFQFNNLTDEPACSALILE